MGEPLFVFGQVAVPRPIICPDCEREKVKHLVHMYRLVPPVRGDYDNTTVIRVGLCHSKELWILETDAGYYGSKNSVVPTEDEFLADEATEDEDAD